MFADAVHARGMSLDTWLPAETDAPPGDPAAYDAVMVFGGAMHADHEERHPWLRDVKALLRDLLERGVPTLGVCLGAQLLAEAAGAQPRRASRPEIGWHDVELTADGCARPGARLAAAAIRGLPVAQLRVPAAAGRDCRWPAAPSACRHSAPGTPWGSSSTRR